MKIDEKAVYLIRAGKLSLKDARNTFKISAPYFYKLRNTKVGVKNFNYIFKYIIRNHQFTRIEFLDEVTYLFNRKNLLYKGFDILEDSSNVTFNIVLPKKKDISRELIELKKELKKFYLKNKNGSKNS